MKSLDFSTSTAARRSFLRLRAARSGIAAALLCALISPPAAGTPEGTPAAPASGGKLTEYVKRLAKVSIESPRDAEQFYQLGRWCEEEGLKEEATRSYERAIRIDPDHAQARAALGYRPFGLGWVLGKPGPTRPPDEGPAAGSAGAASTGTAAAGSAPAGTAPAAKPGKPATALGKAEVKRKPAEGDAKPDAGKVEEMVAAKKRWAQEAAAKLEIKFTAYEDEDFLIHTTYEAGSPKLKALGSSLKSIKKLVVDLLGHPKGAVWPGKLHFIFMRASTECMRFAEAIDGQRFPEDTGYYTVGDAATSHTVFSAMPQKALGDLLGYSALEKLGNSDRYVAPWLREGVAGLAAAKTEEGQKDRLLEQHFSRTAAEIQNNFEGVTLFKLLDTQDVKPNARELVQAEAVTLLVYLQSGGSNRLGQLVQELKSPEAPARTGSDDKLFFAKYAAYQERVVKAAFHESLEKLNEKWKEFVVQKGAEIERSKKDPKGQKPAKAQKPAAKPGGGRSKDGGSKDGKDGGSKDGEKQKG